MYDAVQYTIAAQLKIVVAGSRNLFSLPLFPSLLMSWLVRGCAARYVLAWLWSQVAIGPKIEWHMFYYIWPLPQIGKFVCDVLLPSTATYPLHLLPSSGESVFYIHIILVKTSQFTTWIFAWDPGPFFTRSSHKPIQFCPYVMHPNEVVFVSMLSLNSVMDGGGEWDKLCHDMENKTVKARKYNQGAVHHELIYDEGASI